MQTIDVQVGDIVQFRKQHPCGGWTWEVVRTGADIGVVCTTCHRRILLPRDKFRRSVKKIVSRGSETKGEN
jgi:hypothetical protein